MQVEQVLAECIEALDQGATIEDCLARYPAHAQTLRPLLTVVDELRSQPKPRLAPPAFTQIRATLAAQAQQAAAAQQTTAAAADARAARALAKAQPVLPMNGRNPNPIPPQPERAGHRQQRATQRHQPARSRPPHHYSLSAHQPAARKQQSRLRLLTTGIAVALALFLFVFVRQVMVSLPGGSLYGVKLASEQVQGLLMTAAGEDAQWQAQQATLRIGELANLPAGAAVQQATLAQQVATHVDAALAASAQLTPAEKTVFLARWQTELQQLDAQLQQRATTAEPALATLHAALAAVALAQLPATAPATTILATTATPLPLATLLITETRPMTATLSPLPALVGPTVLTATATPAATLATTVTINDPAGGIGTATPVLIPTATALTIETPTLAPTATPLPVITQVMPHEDSTEREQKHSDERAENSESQPESMAPVTADDGSATTPSETESTPVALDEDAAATATSAATLTPPLWATSTAVGSPTSTPTPPPALTGVPTLRATETSTKLPTPVAEEPTQQATTLPDSTPHGAPTATDEAAPTRNATAEPTRTPKPKPTDGTPEPTRTRRRTPEPTTPPPATAEPTEAITP